MLLVDSLKIEKETKREFGQSVAFILVSVLNGQVVIITLSFILTRRARRRVLDLTVQNRTERD